MSANLTVIKVWVTPIDTGASYIKTAPHILELPKGAVRWEVYQPTDFGTYLQFMAVDENGKILEIHNYAHGQWSKWMGIDAAGIIGFDPRW